MPSSCKMCLSFSLSIIKVKKYISVGKLNTYHSSRDHKGFWGNSEPPHRYWCCIVDRGHLRALELGNWIREPWYFWTCDKWVRVLKVRKGSYSIEICTSILFKHLLICWLERSMDFSISSKRSLICLLDFMIRSLASIYRGSLRVSTCGASASPRAECLILITILES